MDLLTNAMFIFGMVFVGVLIKRNRKLGVVLLPPFKFKGIPKEIPSKNPSISPRILTDNPFFSQQHLHTVTTY